MIFPAVYASLIWTDVTVHHQGRGLQDSQLQGADALVRRSPSETVFVYNLTGSLHPELIASLKQLELPLCTGGQETFELQDSGVLPKELQDSLPSLRSYVGFSKNGYSADIVLTPSGVRAQIWAAGLRCFVDPHTKGKADLHTIYADHDSGPHHLGSKQIPKKKSALLKSPEARRLARKLADASLIVKPLLPPAGYAETYTYTIVVACSFEYIKFAKDYGNAMALLTATMTRVTGIWGRELGIRFTIHPKNALVCSESPSTGIPVIKSGELPNNNPSAWMDGKWAGQTKPMSNIEWLTSKGIDSKTYDIAHYFSIGDAGGLGGQTVCDPVWKGNGGTASPSPAGDSFDVDYVAHEMGHQFGTQHTWSGAGGGCTQDQFNAMSAVELGSGSTLETYAGICDKDDIAIHSSPYFHIYSLAEFQVWFNTGLDSYFGKAKGCGKFAVSTTNRRPTATAPATCSIPRSTPFILTGKGTDLDGDVLSYVWEQLDSSSKRWSISSENKQGPLFISVLPTTTGNARSFPKLSTVMDNAGTSNVDPLERVSTVSRTLHMALTARDKFNPSAEAPADVFGSYHTAFTDVNVAQFGPLAITAPTSAASIQTGIVLVTWEIAGPTGPASTNADNRAVLASTFQLSYSRCTGTGNKPSLAGCGQNWTVLLSNQTVSSQGRGSANVILPASAAGKLIIQVKGTSAQGCEFYSVTPMLTVAVGKVVIPTLTNTLPIQSASDVSINIPAVSMDFSANVFLSTTGTIFSVTPASGTPLTFAVSDVLISGTTVSLLIPTTLQASKTYTVSMTKNSLCAGPEVPCTNAVVLNNWMFTTGAATATNGGATTSATTKTTTTTTTTRTTTAVATTTRAGAVTTTRAGSSATTTTVRTTATTTVKATTTTTRTTTTTPADPRPVNLGGTIPFNSLVYTIAFRAPVAIIKGSITVTDSSGNVYCNINVRDSTQVKLSINTNELRIDFTKCALWSGSTYTVSTDSTTFKTLKGAWVQKMSFQIVTTKDVSVPKIEELYPANASTDVAEYESVGLIFDNYIEIDPNAKGSILFKDLTNKGAGDLTVSLDDCCDDTTAITVYPDSGEVIITPWELFAPKTLYSVIIPAKIFRGWDGTYFPGISLGKYVFKTGDSFPPEIQDVSFTVLGLSVVAAITFDEQLTAGQKSFLLVNEDNQTLASVQAQSSDVSIKGMTVTVTFPVVYIPTGMTSVEVALQYNSGVVLDDAGNGVDALNTFEFPVTVKSSFAKSTVSTSLSLSVPNATLFVMDPSNIMLVNKGIGNALAVPFSWVSVSLSLPGQSATFLASQTPATVVNVACTVTVPSNAPKTQNAAAIQSALDKFKTSPSQLQTSLTRSTGVSVTAVVFATTTTKTTTTTTVTTTKTTTKAAATTTKLTTKAAATTTKLTTKATATTTRAR